MNYRLFRVVNAAHRWGYIANATFQVRHLLRNNKVVEEVIGNPYENCLIPLKNNVRKMKYYNFNRSVNEHSNSRLIGRLNLKKSEVVNEEISVSLPFFLLSLSLSNENVIDKQGEFAGKIWTESLMSSQGSAFMIRRGSSSSFNPPLRRITSKVTLS